MVRDRTGQHSASKQKTELPPKRIKDGKILHRYYERKGNGSCGYSHKCGAGWINSIKEFPSDSQFQDFLEWLEENDLDKEDAYFTVWDDDEKRVKILLGKIPFDGWHKAEIPVPDNVQNLHNDFEDDDDFSL
jgi:hypothetical protein